MKNSKKKLLGLAAVILAVMTVLSACGSKSSEGESEVELTWYLPLAAIPADVQSVEDEVNKITKAKINATVKLKVQTFGDYTQKMNTVVASGEKADIIWTSNWNFDYVQNQAKGAFLPLDDLIAKYAPDVKKSVPDFVWDSLKIDGKIHAIPNYQTVTNKEGFYVQKRFADKYNLDVNSIKKLADIEPFLEQIKKNEKGVTPFVVDRRGKLINAPRQFNLEPIGNLNTNVIGIDLGNPDKIINVYESENYKKYLDFIRSWYTKGYINEDAAVLKNVADLSKTGEVAVDFHNALKPGGAVERKATSGGQEIIEIPLTEPYITSGTTIATNQAISRTSANPERAMMLINLVNTDKELYNLLVYGIEGKHYTKVSDNVVKVKEDSSYKAADWVFGNVFNGYLLEGKDPGVPEETRKENESAITSPINGFKFDSAPVAAEIANVTSVIDQYGPGLNTGIVETEDKLAEFQKKLNEAGAEKVVAEAQKQLDEWKKTK
ncbi:ABC transporter substrate-binding protein [Saccharibacillus brassicae]|uniref:ABC transporter substrate-binding protein n=1 Tax=Saccharibacillus brassicae TaxID=2583377 RepID=A0A4Y6V3J4_SACBS|nr:ABC transporter substrate-binding protein [Saccharibacillus brassicae]QDH23077.1 ABC transporter substrate-binding protein [Saccharibacillus brassicae]